MENYKPSAKEIQNMWQQDKVIMVPVIISSTGIVPKNIHKSTEYLQQKRNMYVTVKCVIQVFHRMPSYFIN
jgi:hypothetical protein